MIETWKDAPGYEGLYKVSNLGNVYSLIRNKIMQGKIDKDGYREVILTKNKIKKTIKVHRLVALSFISNPNKKPQVNHIDRNKTNNNVNNLEWVTASENIKHTFKTGRKVYKRCVEQLDRDNKFIKKWNSIEEASKKLKICNHNISYCCSGKLKSAGGYIWKYAEKEVI